MTGADEVLFVPTDEIVAESLGDAYHPNEAPKTKRKRRRKKRFADPAALELYGGEEGFLVRTAVIRAQDYDESQAPRLSTPDRAWPIVRHLGYADQEHVVVLALDANARLLAIHESAIGGTSSAEVAVRHAVKVPLLVSASAVILCHNHPSGSLVFSGEDIIMTKSYAKALSCVGLSLLDHILVARSGFVSYLDEYGTPA